MAEQAQEHKTGWMIYGAYGYSGELIAREAVRRGLRPVLAGRNAGQLKALGESLGLTWRVFGLDAPDTVSHALADMRLVIHCAGPFSATAKPMLEGCLEAGTHYLDITGEISVFEQAKALDARAREAGVTLCPGTGFDVIPTDCLARLLADKMPDATHLDLAFAGGAALSPGTAQTSIEGMAEGVAVREAGQIVRKRSGYTTRDIDFGKGAKQATPIPWGDVSTAYTSTQIPNIRVFVPASPRTLKAMKRANLLRPLLRLGVVQNLLKSRVRKTVKGPDAQARAKMRMSVWGEVRNAQGQRLSASVETPNGYDVTTWGPLLIAQHLLDGADAPGYKTPSLLMGGDWLRGLPGVGPVDFRDEAAASD